MGDLMFGIGMGMVMVAEYGLWVLAGVRKKGLIPRWWGEREGGRRGRGGRGGDPR